MSRRRACVLSAAVAFSVASGPGALGLTINIDPASGGGLDPTSSSYNAQAAAAFQAAANDLGSRFSDNISVNVTADLTSAGFSSANIIGQTSASQVGYAYNSVRSALISDGTANPTNNTLAVGNALPSAPAFDLSGAAGTSANGSSYSFAVATSGKRTPQPVISLTTAEAKALPTLGYTSTPTATDGTITFNSNFAFSYTGPQPNTIDFKTVAEHELIHLLGFDSATDAVDEDKAYAATAGAVTTTTTFNINPTVLDFYRFSSANVPTTLAGFTANDRDLTPGSNDYTSDANDKLQMSTGAYYGDGNQASHWKADELTGLNLGIMDPTLADDQATAVSDNDLRALELLGYDVVAAPEPGSFALLAFGSTLFARRRRRTARRGSRRYPSQFSSAVTA